MGCVHHVNGKDINNCVYVYLCIGAVQGIITGIRGLCNGLGPALFGLMFFIFHVDLDSPKPGSPINTNSTLTKTSNGGDPSLRVSTIGI